MCGLCIQGCGDPLPKGKPSIAPASLPKTSSKDLASGNGFSKRSHFLKKTGLVFPNGSRLTALGIGHLAGSQEASFPATGHRPLNKPRSPNRKDKTASFGSRSDRSASVCEARRGPKAAALAGVTADRATALDGLGGGRRSVQSGHPMHLQGFDHAVENQPPTDR